MEKTYSPDIGQRVGLTNPGPVFNGRFSHRQKLVLDGLNNFGIGNSPESKNLQRECQEHRREFKKAIDAPNLIVLVHPFYTWLNHFDYVTPKNRRGLEVYTENLLNLLDANLDREKVGLLAFETAYHYTALTSALLEQGKIDDVLFTEDDSGRPKDEIDFQPHRTRQVYLGGGYSDRCLRSAGGAISRQTENKRIYVISNLIVCPPSSAQFILPRNKQEAANRVSAGFQVNPQDLVTAKQVIAKFKS
ncbi:Uncharacterised protein [uncultured archaeon]|nr:Uncharacterised protein [uncultured archaeon]